MSTKFMAAYHRAMHNLSTFIQRNEKKRASRASTGAMDVQAREIIVAQQAQIEALQRGMNVLGDYFITDAGNKLTRYRVSLTQALEIKEPTYNLIEDEDDVDVEPDNPEVESLVAEIIAGEPSEQNMLADWILTGANILHSITKKFRNDTIEFHTEDDYTANNLRTFLNRTAVPWASSGIEDLKNYVTSVKLSDARISCPPPEMLSSFTQPEIVTVQEREFGADIIDSSTFNLSEWEWPLTFSITVIESTDFNYRCLYIRIDSLCNKVLLCRTFRQMMGLYGEDITLTSEGFILKRKSDRLLNQMGEKIRPEDGGTQHFHFNKGDFND